MKYSLPFLLFLLYTFSLAAQDIQPVLQVGHSSKIQFYSVSYEKNLLMTADENEIMLWNTLSGKQLRRIAAPFKIKGAGLCSNGEEIAVITYEYNRDASLRIYSSRTGELLSVVSFAENNWGAQYYPTLDELVFDNKFNRVAVRAFSNMTIVDIPERKKLYHFKLSSYDNNFCFSAAPNIFGLSFTESGKLRSALVDTSGSMIQVADVAAEAKQAGMIQDPSNDRFFLLDSKGIIHVLNNKLQQVDSVRSDSADRISSYSAPEMHLSADGKKLLVPLYKNHYCYDLEKKQWNQLNQKWINYSTGLLFANEEADKIIRVEEKYSSILDAGNGEAIHTLSTKAARNSSMIFSPSGRMISSFQSSTVSKSTNILDLKTGMQFGEEIDLAVFQWITDSVVLCAPYPKWDDKAIEFIYSVEIRNIYTGKIYRSVSLPKISSIDYASISNDGKKIALVTMKEVFLLSGKEFERKVSFKMPGTSLARRVYFTPDSKKVFLTSELIRVYDFDSRKWTQLKDTASYSFTGLAFTPDSKQMWYEDYRATSADGVRGFDMKQVIVAYDIETGNAVVRRTFDSLVASIAVHPKEDLYAIGFFNGTIQLRKRSDDQLLYERKDHYGHIDEIIFAPTKKWMLSRGEDGLIRFMDLDSKEHIVSVGFVYSNGESGYALLAPDNAYLVPASLINELHFVKDYDVYSFSQLDLKLNRPDKVLERLSLAEPELLDMHRKAYKRRLAKAGYSDEKLLPDITTLAPLRIVNRKQVSYSVSQPMINLKLMTTQPSSEIKALNVYVNGQLVNQIKAHVSEWDAPVLLSLGRNNIEVAYVSTGGMESLRERVETKYIPSNPVKTNYYYIGIAVSGYKDSSMNLKYTVKDVTDIAARYKEKDSTVKTYLFTNENATRSNLDSIKKILTGTAINDKVVISFSGHGVLDTAYNFFFAGWDMDFADPSKYGISFSDINNLLDSIPARQKLVLMDACHSGEVDRDVISFAGSVSDTQFVKGYGRSSIIVKKKNKLQNTVKLMEQYFTDVSKNNGANIISAAAGEEYALESSEWNNGVFSYSFMKGFFEKGADKNYDGVSQSEIRKYMQELVLKLTKGKQQPTSRSINSDFDWHL